MEEELLSQWRRFKEHVGDPLAAAVLTLAAVTAGKAITQQSLNYEEAAKYLGVHRDTVRALVTDGTLVPLRIGRLCRFSVEDLQTFQRRKTPIHRRPPRLQEEIMFNKVLRLFRREQEPQSAVQPVAESPARSHQSDEEGDASRGLQHHLDGRRADRSRLWRVALHPRRTMSNSS